MEVVEQHTNSQSVHMPWEKKVEVFILRKEFDAHALRDSQSLTEIRATLERIDTKIERLYETRSQ
jgi:hypothetical protein